VRETSPSVQHVVSIRQGVARRKLPTRRSALSIAQRDLSGAGIETAALDGRVLLSHVLGVSAAELYSSLYDALNDSAYLVFRQLVERRMAGEPVAYLTGRREFYGIDLEVCKDVLVPRPETELLVERALALLPPRALVADVGCGSGAIGVAVAWHRPDVRVLAIDTSPAACRAAAGNVERLGLTSRVGVICGDLLAPARSPLDAVLANLPYLSEADLAALSRDVRHEPRSALDGGTDGLDLYRRLFEDLAGRRPQPAVVLCEIGPLQAEAMSGMASAALPEHRVRVLDDLAGHPRLVETVSSTRA